MRGFSMNRVRQARGVRGLNQRELSELAHTPQSLVSSIERERLRPWPKVAKRLSKVLGIPVRDLFPEDFKK
jgi:ribosome-binding protein aMBF1 (putative translation factor)